MRKCVLIPAAMVAATMLAGPSLAQVPVTTVSEVEQTLKAKGYTSIHDIERDDGVWEADVRRPDGRKVDVVIDPATGEVFDAFDGRAVLDVKHILEKAESHGLTDIRKLERDGATWKIKARDAEKRPVEARLSGTDGRVLYRERDHWWD